METVALNLANMLQTAIQRRNQLLYENDIALSSEETMRGNYVRLDVALADLANTMGGSNSLTSQSKQITMTCLRRI